MKREEIVSRLQSIFQDLLDDENAVISEETSRENTEEWDSLFHMTLMATVMDEFGVSFTSEQLTDTKDVGTLISIIESMKN